MGLKRWMFGSSEEISPDIKFGRYSDLYKDSSKKKSWDLALQASEANDYLNVYKHFIEYIRDDDAQNFASIKSDDDSLDFAFYQGSKVINVCINNEFIEAEAKIAKCINPHLEVFRSLLEDNYTLRYCKYCLDEEQNLTMVFQSNHKDANPYKLYYGLKELATIADHKDDALINKYSEFEAINNKHIKAVNSVVMKAKFEYFSNEVNALLHSINNDALTTRSQMGSFAFLVSSFAYKMDYLLVPEGRIMQKLDKIIELVNQESSNLHANSSEIMHLLQLLNNKDEFDLSHEFYDSKHTFGVTSPVDHQYVADLIQSNQETLKWYISKHQFKLSSAVCDFVLGKLIYDHALPAYDRDLAQLYFRVTEPIYFSSLGMKGLVKGGKIKKSEVLAIIDQINSNAKKDGITLQINQSKLMWDNISFGPSLLYLILNLNPKSE
jgi:hypothetical protein